MKNLFKTRTTLFIASIAISVIGFQACKKETLPKNTENGPNVVNVQDYKAAYVNVFGNAADFQDIAILNGVTP